MPSGGQSSRNIGFTYDRDWFKVTLAAGGRYQFDLKGQNSGSGTLDNPYLEIYDTYGMRRLQVDDNSGYYSEARISFVAPEDGTYYVVARDRGRETGTYEMSTTMVNGQRTLTTGSPLVASIYRSGEEDWYKLQLQAGKRYRVLVSGSSTGGGTLYDSYMRIHKDIDAGYLAAFNNRVGKDAQLYFAPSSTDDYWIMARGYNRYTGTYTMEFEELSTTSLAVNGSANGTISSSGEEDWYTVNLVQGANYTFTLKGSSSSSGTLDDPELNVYDTTMLFKQLSDGDSGTGTDAKISFRAPETGTFHLLAEGNGSYTGTYTISATQESNDPTLSVGGSNTGTISSSELDFFRVTLEKGKRYQFDLKGSSSGSGTLYDPFLYLFEADGQTIISRNSNSGAGRDARMTYVAKSSDVYFLAARGYSGTTGSYTIAATQLADGTTSLTVGNNISGTISQSREVDRYKVTLSAGDNYYFNLKGASSGYGSLTDPFLVLWDEDFKAVFTDNNSGYGTDARMKFHATTSGTYYLDVRHRYSGVGSYRLTSRELETDDYGDSSAASAALSVGGELQARIEASNDEDWFRVNLQANSTYQFDMTGYSNSSWDDLPLTDSYLFLYDTDGSSLIDKSNDLSPSSRNSRLVFTAQSTGTYYLKSMSRDGNTGYYRLTAALTSTV